MKRLLPALIVLFSCLSCGEDKKETETEELKPLSFSSKTIEEKLDNCQPENGDCTFINLNFPVAENGRGEAEKINKNIELFLLNTIDYNDEGEARKPEELARNFIEDYQETAREFPEYELPWEATITGKLVYRSPEIISLKFNTDMFTGGAHGYRSTNYLNFDPITGEKLKPEAIFSSEFIDFVEKDFREKQDIPIDSNINSTGMFFENDEFHLPANIGFTREEIILHYNAYEIAPYSAGNFVLSYPRESVQQFIKLKKDSLPES
ncbi:DUF3298 and DUF4163 domain-containing protein [Pontixanthobacter gangjinensis]|uniref:DUF3298 and DUF4163 domain-containing protein n=1 Tax=Christiangramia aestuarii TaxID=1028746 RepID=A0A7K1LT25_9FLAO|nr:DUF3298 and DUF4163 domain-containing protein [Christiangramia aestuarii]MUP43741.1 DUF3298 and DUF4163 domain-containing protein [Christiangramia aestuarii]